MRSGCPKSAAYVAVTIATSLVATMFLGTDLAWCVDEVPAIAPPTLPTPAEPEIDPAAHGVDPEASRLLRRMADTLATAQSFSVRAQIEHDEVYESGSKLQFGAVATVNVRRPRGIIIDYDGDDAQKRVWYNGYTLTLLDVSENVYASETVPPFIDPMLDDVRRRYGLTLPLSDLLETDLYRSTMNAARLGVVVGTAWVGDIECDHLAFAEPTIDWQVWIERGRRPLPHKIVVTYKKLPASPQYQARLSDWNLAANLPESLFQPDLGDAARIDFMPFGEAR